MPKPKVELIPAHEWTCPTCGNTAFVSCVTIEHEAVETMIPAEQREQFEGIRGHWLMAPGHVQCSHCGEEFETECGP